MQLNVPTFSDVHAIASFKGGSYGTENCKKEVSNPMKRVGNVVEKKYLAEC